MFVIWHRCGDVKLEDSQFLDNNLRVKDMDRHAQQSENNKQLFEIDLVLKKKCFCSAVRIELHK